MAEYIDRDAAIELLHYNADETCSAVVSDFEAIPTADIDRPTKSQFKRMAAQMDYAPVVHGRWEDSIDEWFGTDVYTCSKCRESYVLVEGTPKENLWHYCPNCGARMDGDSDG